jgi:hypothetical protein
MKERFRHEWILRWNYPKTDNIVHEYSKLKTYVNAVGENYPATYSENNIQYTLGVGFYPARSYKDNYVQKFSNDTAYLLKKRYTVFLTPVYFTTKDSVIEYEEDDIRKTLTVRVLDSVKTPFDTLKNRNEEYLQFARKVHQWMNKNKEFAFDLGHTHP